MNRISSRTLQVLLLAAVLAAPSLASASAGKVLFTLGRVDIQRQGAVISAARGTVVEPGDQFEVGPTGRTQIRMNDGAMIALQPGSSFVIEEYQLPESTPASPAETLVPATASPDPLAVAPAPTRTSPGGRALFSLLKGGFRTITGLIGKGGQDVYLLKTPAATIGIRGTDYSATYCSGNCGSAPTGLYVGVSSGKIVVTNNSGSLSLGDNQYGFVQDENAPPEKTLEPPVDVLDPQIQETDEKDESGDASDAPGAPASGDGTEGSGDAEGMSDSGDGTTGGESASAADDSSAPSDFGDGGGSAFDGPPPDTSSDSPPASAPIESRPPEVPGADPTVAPTRAIAHSTGPLSGSAKFAGVSLDATAQFSIEGDLTGFRSSVPPDGVGDYGLGTAQNVNQGYDPATDMRWGRWSTGAASVGSSGLSLASQSLHWIFGPETLEQPTLPITGTASYSLVGNTDPTDNLGNVGFLGSAQFSANFSTQTVSSSLSLGINNQVWSASGSGSIINGFPMFAGDYVSVSVNGQAGGAGSFAGFFTAPPGGGVPLGAGLSYSLNSGATTVSGAAAFGNPALVSPPQ